MISIDLHPYDTADFNTCLWVEVAVTAPVGQEYLVDYKQYLIRLEDISEVRQLILDGSCMIAMESGLSHTLSTTTAIIEIGGTSITDNDMLYDKLCQVATQTWTP